MSSPVVTLYYVPRSRATRARWALEELGVPYRLVRLDSASKDVWRAEHLARHPLGRVPVLETPDGMLFESVAICLHLAANTPLLPVDGSRSRALVHQWLFFAVTELEGLLGRFAGERNKASPDAGRVAHLRGKLEAPLLALEGALREREWLVDASFTVADLVVGALLVWASRLELLTALPTARAFAARVVERPAYQRAMAD
ncbi:MAG: glutathione S-transferase family protein [Myxococcales bacterium]|nr:glutathione S-transferase family protein [Myxococcales bacterium]